MNPDISTCAYQSAGKMGFVSFGGIFDYREKPGVIHLVQPGVMYFDIMGR